MKDRRILYGRRQGRRLRTGQRELLSEGLETIAIPRPAEGERIDPAGLFARPCAAYWLEVGFGGGEHLAWQAARNPDVGLIGAEPFINGVVSLLGHVRRERLDNVRVLADDARALIDALPNSSIARAFVLHPDPWPKARHHKRRFVAAENLERLARVMVDGGELRLATDDLDYLDWMLEHSLASPHFQWLASGPDAWRDRPADWPVTRYEDKAVKEGRRSWRLAFRRRSRATAG